MNTGCEGQSEHGVDLLVWDYKRFDLVLVGESKTKFGIDSSVEAYPGFRTHKD